MSDVETAEKPGSDVETVEEPGSANYDKWHSALLQKAVHELWRKSEVCWTGTWNTNMNPGIQNVLKRYTSLNRKSVKDAFIRSALNSEHSIAPRQRGPKFLITPLEEEIILKWIAFRTAKKLSPTPAEIRAKAMDILEQRGVSRSVSAGWYRDFLNRHPLVQRCARTMEQNRAGVSSEAVARYFIELEVLEKAKPCDAVWLALPILCIDLYFHCSG